MDAVVYVSNAGHTGKYAELLAKKLSVPLYPPDEAKGKIKKNSEIIFMGWVRKGKITGYKKAAKRYRIKAVIAVGMGIEGEAVEEGLKIKNHVKEPLFYLQGGMNQSLLKGRDAMIIKQYKNTMVPRLEEAAKAMELDEAKRNMLKMLKDGGNAVTVDRLQRIMEFLRK